MGEQDWRKYREEIEKRIEKLENEGYFLEVYFLMSAVLEKRLKHLIGLYEEVFKDCAKKKDLNFCPSKNKIDKNKMSLGQLKEYLKVYCKDQKLIKEIDYFNKLRIDVIHNIFKENITKLQMRIFKSRPRFYKLMEKLTDEEINLIKKIKNY
ncbi:hypothetical protein J7K86_02415 [bacterium]|nr:hypothetical protein [bacterium]